MVVCARAFLALLPLLLPAASLGAAAPIHRPLDFLQPADAVAERGQVEELDHDVTPERRRLAHDDRTWIVLRGDLASGSEHRGVAPRRSDERLHAGADRDR